MIRGYINTLGQRLVPEGMREKVKLSFRVIEAAEPNAFALADGRIYITTGMIAFAENEAQIAATLGHEIGHVLKEHLVSSIYRQTYGKVATASRIAGIAGGLLGGRETQEAMERTMSLVRALTGARFSREQEKEADQVGLELALSAGFDPAEAAKFWEKMDRRFGDPSRVMALFSGHPTHSRRAELAREVVTQDLAAAIASKSGTLGTGSGSYEKLTSVVRRDSGIHMAELLDRYDLALDMLEAVLPVRPDDPKLLWALGRIHNLTEGPSAEGSSAIEYLKRAAEADRRGLFPAIHRDLGYAYATTAEDFPKAAESLQTYLERYVRKHGTYPADLETVYDHLGLFGSPDWVAPGLPREYPDVKVASAAYRAPEWHTPGGSATGVGSESFLQEAYQAYQEYAQGMAAGRGE